jgi:hypothetical protein
MAEDRLYLLAVAFFDAVVDEFAAAGVGLPTRRYVSNGEVAFDCEQFVVQPVQLRTGLPVVQETRSVKLPRLQAFALDAFVTRCVPVHNDQGKPPSDDAIQASAAEVLTDVNVLWRTIGQDWSDCRDAAVGTIEIVGPQGGYVSSLAHVTVQVQ